MSDTRVIHCGGLHAKRRSRTGEEPIELAVGRGPRDVRLHLSHFSKSMQASLSPLAADLIELASYVYVADQTVTRGGIKRFDYGEQWRRRFQFRIPVRKPDAWNRAGVCESLCKLLRFLTDDDYEFEFVRATAPAILDRCLFDSLPPPDEAEFDEVSLFSGGLDSLCGAVQEVLGSQRRVMLFSHRPENRIYARQQGLVAAIQSKLPNRRTAPYHFAAKVNKGKRLNKDFTQRSRSFLFASLAAVVSRSLGLNRVRFYENGVTSLNLPISPQMIGGRASRTTHPQTLFRFSEFFSGLFETEFTVDNPYQWLTKPEILKQLASAGHAGLCAATSSCVHTWDRTEQYPHCGLCSQCVDRRMSILAAGLGDVEDPSLRYQSDVLTGERSGIDLAFVERYVGSAFDVGRLTSTREFAIRFGEIANVIPYTRMAADHAARKIFELYRRHACEVDLALQSAIASRTNSVLHQDYAARSLLGAVVGRTSRSRPLTPSEPDSPDDSQQSRPVFRIDCSRFEAVCGEASCFFGNTNEFWALERLHRAGDRYLSVQTLREDVWKDDRTEKATIQRTLSNVRRKLRDKHFTDVAIDGSQRDHYRLICPRV